MSKTRIQREKITRRSLTPSLDIDYINGRGYLRLSDKPITKTTEERCGLIVDWDIYDSIVGIEFLSLGNLEGFLEQAFRSEEL